MRARRTLSLSRSRLVCGMIGYPLPFLNWRGVYTIEEYSIFDPRCQREPGGPNVEASILYLPSAIVLGALHALEPGHAKTLTAAYLIGTKGTHRDALILGVSVAFA